MHDHIHYTMSSWQAPVEMLVQLLAELVGKTGIHSALAPSIASFLIFGKLSELKYLSTSDGTSPSNPISTAFLVTISHRLLYT